MLNEKTKVNKALLTGWGVVNLILFLAYLLEFLKGARTFGYLVIFLLIAAIPYVAGVILYRIDQESGKLRYIVAYGYVLFYIFVLLTSDTILVFTYVLPILSLLMLCNDVNLLVGFAITSVIGNVISIVYNITKSESVSADIMADYEIQIAAILLCMVLTIVATKVSAQINQFKINQLKEREDKQNEMLHAIQEVAQNISIHTHEITGSMGQITASAVTTTSSMQEVASSSAQTAESIQEQLEKTSQIQEHIETAVTIASGIMDLTQKTTESVLAGIGRMEELDAGAETTREKVCWFHRRQKGWRSVPHRRLILFPLFMELQIKPIC